MINALLVLFGPLVQPFLLVFAPAWTWEREYRAQRGLLFILALFLLPLLVLGSLGEAYRLVTWGMLQGEFAHRKAFSPGETAVFEAGQFLLWFLVVVAGAVMVKSIGETFHSRHTFSQAFATVTYALSPLLLLRLLDGIKDLPPWVSWSIGILLSIRVLYSGVPRMMQPDPAHAFGLFLMSAFLLLLTTGLAELLTACYLIGKFPKVEALISHLAVRLPF
jgi:hypothetical protein